MKKTILVMLVFLFGCSSSSVNYTNTPIDKSADTIECTYQEGSLLGYSSRHPLDNSFLYSFIKKFTYNPNIHYVVRDNIHCSDAEAGCRIVFKNMRDNTATLVGNMGDSKVDLFRDPNQLIFIERPIISSTINVFSLDLNTGLIVGTKNVDTMVGDGYGAIYLGHCKAIKASD